jgi:transposase-like protein
MKKQRKHYAPEEKVAILRRHLLEKEPISKLCDQVGLQPTVFYRWQKEFFENGAAAFEQKARPESCLFVNATPSGRINPAATTSHRRALSARLDWPCGESRLRNELDRRLRPGSFRLTNRAGGCPGSQGSEAACRDARQALPHAAATSASGSHRRPSR